MRWFVLLFVVSTACGGETGSNAGSSSGGSSTGGASTGGSATGGAPTGGSGGVSLGGSSSGGSATGGAPSCGPIDSGAPCSTLVEAQCLATHPRCVPLYDDQCCPICDLTAPCADCVDKKFIGCTEFELSICTPGAVGPCGMTPNWACTGGVASCPTSEPCNTTPGCVAATSSPCTPEGCEIECHPLTRYSCFEPCATTEKPSCQSSTREGTESGYSGYCIPNEACGCPAVAPKSGSACTLEGFSCNYGKCHPRCRCDGSVWSCVSDLC